MMRIAFVIIFCLAVTTPGSAEVEFSLNISSSGSLAELYREARLAEWNSPMGRVNYHAQQQFTSMLRGGQPGVGMVPVLRFRIQHGQPLTLISAAANAGIDISQQQLLEIPWPWMDESERPELTFEEQVGLLFGSQILLGPDPASTADDGENSSGESP